VKRPSIDSRLGEYETKPAKIGVIPAKAGIHLDRLLWHYSKAKWLPAFAE
jgi:hypothetical protein